MGQFSKSKMSAKTFRRVAWRLSNVNLKRAEKIRAHCHYRGRTGRVVSPRWLNCLVGKADPIYRSVMFDGGSRAGAEGQSLLRQPDGDFGATGGFPGERPRSFRAISVCRGKNNMLDPLCFGPKRRWPGIPDECAVLGCS